MDSLIPLVAPMTDFAVEILEILEGVDPEEISQIPQGPFNSSLLIGR